MSPGQNQDFIEDDEPEVQRAVPPRARQQFVTGKKKATSKASRAKERIRPTVPRAEAVAEAPVRRNNPRPPPREESNRDLARETTRPGAVVVMGRDGEPLTRRRTGTGDKFDVPANYIPTGWTYQWNPVTVLGQNIGELIVQSDLHMHENGWRPVPASRHPGHWTPRNHDGAIVIEGLRLEERPASLTKEALAEDEMRAKMQIRSRTDALRMTQKALPGANEAMRRGNAGGMRMEIDPGLDIPRPQHQIDDGGGE